jgi:serine protease Do
VEATDLQPVTPGRQATPERGDHVLAIGNPLCELTFSMSEGIALLGQTAAINVDGTPFNMIQVTGLHQTRQTPAARLLNSYGEVIGIVSAKYSSYASESVEGPGLRNPHQ